MKRIILLLIMLSLLISSCSMFNNTGTLEIKNNSSEVITVLDVSGRFMSSTNVIFQPNDYKTYHENGKGEGADILLLINGINYIADTGYIADYNIIKLFIIDGNKYTVLHNNTELFTRDLTLVN